MDRRTLLCTLVAVSLAGGGPALAQRDDRQGRARQSDRRMPPQFQQRAQPQPPGRGPGQRARPDRRRRDQPPQQARRGEFGQDERGAGPDHRFHRGDRLPPEYHNRNYVVDDWRGHHLRAPPRGYHWVQIGGDYVLVAIATGIIMQLLLNH